MNLKLNLSLLLISISIFPSAVESENILVFHSMASASHRIAIWPLIEKLADKGHNITYLFPVTTRFGSHPQVVEITPSKMVPILTDYVLQFDVKIRLENKLEEWLDKVMETVYKLCGAFYDSPEVKEWLSKPDLHYDLILIDGCLGECAYGLVHRFKAKFILFLPFFIPHLIDPFGLPTTESASIPDFLHHAKPNQMNLYNRVWTTLIPFIWRSSLLKYMERIEPVIREGLNIPDLPALTQIEQNASLVMLNSFFVEDYPYALPPMFVSFSGLWCSKAMLSTRKPLPADLSNFVDKGEQGFFYISLGSATDASSMPKELRDQFFNAFRAFPKLRFLWRWTAPAPEDTPDNLLLLPWFPQHDILVHPKLIAFVTQAGRPSTQEAVCHGVPLITIPIFADQDFNADRMESLGASINVDISNVTTEVLVRSFREISENPSYRNRMQQLSTLFRDRPIDALDNVLYWTEYVLRHNDTNLLKPLAMKKTWYERRLLDVYAVLALLGLGILSALVLLTCIAFRVVRKITMGKPEKMKTR